MSKKILGKLQTRKVRMIGRKTVAKLSSFRLISPRLVEFTSFGLFWLALPLGLGLLDRVSDGLTLLENIDSVSLLG